MDHFLGLAYHKWPDGVLHPAVSHRKATKQALEMVGLANSDLCRGGSDSRCVLFWSAIGNSWPHPKSAGDKGLLFTMTSLLTLAAALAVFIRLRCAIGVERQQIKWFAYAAAAYASAGILAYIIPRVIDTPLWFERVGFALNIAFIPAIPIAIGIAILRYRLYDIDILINRTLVYGSLTLMLALVYFGGVTATQVVFTALTGQ